MAQEFKPEPVVDLPAENAALKARVAVLENELRSRDTEIDRLLGKPKKRAVRKLDEKAPDAFARPYRGG